MTRHILSAPRVEAPRFQVEMIGRQFALLDTVTSTTTPLPRGTTRFAADQLCAGWNDLLPGKTTAEQPATASALPLFREFQQTGVTPERLFRLELEENGGARHMDEPALTVRQQQRVDTYKTWLVPMLHAWAAEVALQAGYGGAKRRTWSTQAIIKMIEADSFRFRDSDTSDDAISSLHYDVFASDRTCVHHRDDDRVMELRKVLSVHYLSSDSANLKAGFLGLSKRTYLRQVDAAHRMVAARWIG